MMTQTEAEKAEVASLLNALLDVQRQKRAQEKAEKLLAYRQGMQALALQGYGITDRGRFDEMTGEMEDRASGAGYDTEDSRSSSSSRLLSFTTSTARSTSSSARHSRATGPSLYGEDQDHTNLGAYEPVLTLPHSEVFKTPANASHSSLPVILPEVFATVETTVPSSRVLPRLTGIFAFPCATAGWGIVQSTMHTSSG